MTDHARKTKPQPVVTKFRGPNFWLRVVNSQEMPIMRVTIRQVAAITAQIKSSALEMARAVAMDPLMSARIMRMANSAYYNPGIKNVISINRAVVILGFDAIRQVVLNVQPLEEQMRKFRFYGMMHELYQSYLRAYCAQRVIEHFRDNNPGEVYTAALLYSLGDLALWCVAPTSMLRKLDRMLRKDPDVPTDPLKKEVFGFIPRYLTMKLTDDWKLGGVLKKALADGKPQDERSKAIRLSHGLIEALPWGKESRRMQKAMEELGDWLKISRESMETMVERIEEQGQAWARHVGFQPERPSPFEAVLEKIEESPIERSEEHEESVTAYEPSPEVQLEFLAEMARFLVFDEERNSKRLIELTCDGLIKGVGLDRVLFLKTSGDGRFLEVKKMVGWEDPLLKGLMIPVERYPNLFGHALGVTEGLWIRPSMSDEVRSLFTADVRQFFDKPPFVLMSIHGKKGPVGMMAADRGLTGRALDEEIFEGFQCFVLHTSLGFLALGL